MMNGFDLLMRAARLEDSRLKPGDKAILCAVASYFNEDAGRAFPSLEQVMRRAAYHDRKTLIDAIRRVEKLGFLTVERATGSGNRYRLNLSGTSGENPHELGKPEPVPENHTGVVGKNHTGVGGKTPTLNTKEIQTKNKGNGSVTTAVVTPAVAPLPDEDPDAFSLTPETPEAKPARSGIPSCPAQKLIDIFNARCGAGMRTVRILTPARASALAARWRFIWKDCACSTTDEAVEAWGNFCNRVAASDFLMNRTERRFRGGLDRIITPQFFTNIIEGKYDD